MWQNSAGVVIAASLLLAGCANPVQQVSASSRRLEADIATTCANWDAQARNAANLDATTIARHDQLMAEAVKYAAEAKVHFSNAAQFDAANAKEAKAQLDAAALYDVQSKIQNAASCRQELAMVQQTHAQMYYQLSQDSAQPVQTPSFMPNPSVYQLDTQPPAAPVNTTPPIDLSRTYLPAIPPGGNGPGAYVGHVSGGPDVYVIP